MRRRSWPFLWHEEVQLFLEHSDNCLKIKKEEIRLLDLNLLSGVYPSNFAALLTKFISNESRRIFQETFGIYTSLCIASATLLRNNNLFND